MQWYKKFRTYNNGSLQQTWASSFGKATLDELKTETREFLGHMVVKMIILGCWKISWIKETFLCSKSTVVVQKRPHSQ